jgi:hypothetical protein
MRPVSIQSITVLAALAVLLSGCGGTGAGGDVPVLASPGPAPAPTPSPSASFSVGDQITVRVKNKLIGQISQIARGADGWTWIQDDNLIVTCVATGAASVDCEAYASEPYAYDYEEVF